MNRKQFIFVLLALAVIGGAGLILFNRNRESWSVHESKMGDKVLPNFRFNDVAAIHIKGTSEVTVERTGGLWRVKERGGYPANYPQIKNLLITIRDLKVVQSETVGASQLAYVDLKEPGNKDGAGILVEFKDEKGKVLDSLLVGKKHERLQDESIAFNLHGAYDGRYILLPNDPGDVLLISDELSSIASRPELWLNRDFFKIENIKSMSLISTNSTELWKLSRDTESSPWNLAGSHPGESLDSDAVSRTEDVLGFPSFLDVASKSTPRETGLEMPWILKAETFDHLNYTLKIGTKDSQGNYRMSIAVDGKIVAPPVDISDKKVDVAQADEPSPEEKFKSLKNKLSREQSLSQWVYVLDSRLVEPILRDRSRMIGVSKIASQ